MADKHGLNYDVRELKLGASFTNNKATQYHTIKYDFKPASVDVNKMATVDVGTNNQVTVTVPHLDGAGVPQTVFKGSQRPYAKECVLIIDRVTGDITLEKLSSNIQVKKTRQECSSKPRAQTPGTCEPNTTQRSSSRTRVATNARRSNPIGPGQAGGGTPRAAPPGMMRSPARHKPDPPQAAPWSGGNSTLASLPMIGVDEAPAPAPAHNGYSRAPPAPAPAHLAHIHPPPTIQYPTPNVRPSEPEVAVGVVGAAGSVGVTGSLGAAGSVGATGAAGSGSSSSSSSDSGSDSDSNSDSDSERRPPRPAPDGPSHPPLPSDVLNDDLCLSESGSDSD